MNTELRIKIKKAMEVQYNLHNETVTMQCVAAVLFPSRNPKTQVANLNNLLSGHTRIMGEHIKQLIEIFPDTDGNYWLGLYDDWHTTEMMFRAFYKVDEIHDNYELSLLYQMILERQYAAFLFNKYL